MAITWSISRDQALHTCERRYYFEYLTTAKINSRDATLREIAFLKKLKSIPMWLGNSFHSLVADYLNSIRQGMPLSPAALLDRLRKVTEREWAFSASRSFRVQPRQIDQDGGLALFEHEYDGDIRDENYATAVDSIETWFNRFTTWARENELANAVRAASRIWIEPRVYGPHAPGFVLDNVQVMVKVDLVFINPDGKFEIFDWKTGSPAPRSVRQIDRNEFQVNVYQLWPHLALGYPLESIQAHLVYLGSDPVHQKTFQIDQNLREYTLTVIRRSIARVLHFANAHRAAELSLNDFDFATFPAACQRCSFKRLCQRTLEA